MSTLPASSLFLPFAIPLPAQRTRHRRGTPEPVRIAPPHVCTLVEQQDAGRAEAEAFIRARYAASYGCRIEHFMPRLFAVRDCAGEIRGAFGLRDAREPLFLEHYLDRPIERLIPGDSGAPTARAHIVEVGNFSGAFPGAMRTMIALLTEKLQRDGIAWVAFTGTAELRNAFMRQGLDLVDLGAAGVERLPEPARAAWGSYYAHAPRVSLCNVNASWRILNARCAPPHA